MKKSRLLGAVSACVFSLITTSTNAVIIVQDALSLAGVSLELISPTGFSEFILLNGTTQYFVVYPFAEGSAVDGNFNGREEAATELISLNLSGNSSLGSIVIALDPSSASKGGLEEQVNINTEILDVPPFTTGPLFVDSFINIFVDISIGSLVLHNLDPIQLAGTWSQVPSTNNEFVAMFADFEPVTLFDENGFDTGLVLGPGQAVPVPAAAWLFGSGLLGLIGISRKKQLNSGRSAFLSNPDI
ncbi:MAG: VPLPA-CTERM sorting domain-containing protein [Gammaproteobacteria bacterium]